MNELAIYLIGVAVGGFLFVLFGIFAINIFLIAVENLRACANVAD